MTRRDYEAIAAVLKLREGDSQEHRIIIGEAVRGLAAVFAESNPRFNRIKFLEACGVTP